MDVPSNNLCGKLFMLVRPITFNVLLLILCIVSLHTEAQTPRSDCAPMVNDKSWYAGGQKAPLFPGMDGLNFSVTTSSMEARKYFTQGMILFYSSRRAEAARSFFESMRIDKNCAMCHWGFALSLGPGYHAGMDNENIQLAYNSVQKSIELSRNASQKENMLIMALSMRYDSVQTHDRSWKDEMYTFSMAGIYQAFPDDPEIGLLYADALLSQYAGDLWDKDGKPKRWTVDLIKVLEDVLEKDPRHPGANLFYVLAMESSAEPERAISNADLLRNLVPGESRYNHMSSHIYLRTGKYHEAILTNQEAIEAEKEYVKSCVSLGVNPFSNLEHYYHLKAAAAMQSGDLKTALKSSRNLRELAVQQNNHLPEGIRQHYYSLLHYMMVKFGMYEEIHREKSPSDDWLYSRAVFEYAKGMAALASGDTIKAQSHLLAMEGLQKDSTMKDLYIAGLGSASDVLNVSLLVLKAELMNRLGSSAAGLELLMQAARREDRMKKLTAPAWFFSARHNLAAIAMEQLNFVLTEEVLREDLKNYPLNVWALSGMKETLRLLQKTEEAKLAGEQFEKAMKHSDVKINSPRIF